MSGSGGDEKSGRLPAEAIGPPCMQAELLPSRGDREEVWCTKEPARLDVKIKSTREGDPSPPEQSHATLAGREDQNQTHTAAKLKNRISPRSEESK